MRLHSPPDSFRRFLPAQASFIIQGVVNAEKWRLRVVVGGMKSGDEYLKFYERVKLLAKAGTTEQQLVAAGACKGTLHMYRAIEAYRAVMVDPAALQVARAKGHVMGDAKLAGLAAAHALRSLKSSFNSKDLAALKKAEIVVKAMGFT